MTDSLKDLQHRVQELHDRILGLMLMTLIGWGILLIIIIMLARGA